MIILAIRTDKPETEFYLYDNKKKIAKVRWQAHRELAETIHVRIAEMLNQSSIAMDDIGAIICFKGPGSFTGLRIGLSVANALAYAQNIPIVAAGGNDWLKGWLMELLQGHNDKIAIPFYGQPAKPTQPKK